jgi:hypothetical protein
LLVLRDVDLDLDRFADEALRDDARRDEDALRADAALRDDAALRVRVLDDERARPPALAPLRPPLLRPPLRPPRRIGSWFSGLP